MLAPHKSFIQIPLILDQPGVGEGLLDQMAYPLYFSIDNKNQDHSKTAQAKFINPARLLSPREIWNYLFYGKGNFVILIFIAVMQNAIIYIYIFINSGISFCFVWEFLSWTQNFLVAKIKELKLGFFSKLSVFIYHGMVEGYRIICPFKILYWKNRPNNSVISQHESAKRYNYPLWIIYYRINGLAAFRWTYSGAQIKSDNLGGTFLFYVILTVS